MPPPCSGCCAPHTVPACRGRERQTVWHGQDLILQWFKHMGAWVHLQSLPTDHCRMAESAGPDSAAMEGPPSLPAPSCTPKHTPENTFPGLPRNNWGPLSLQGHHLQPFPSSSISHRGQIQRSSSCMAPARSPWAARAQPRIPRTGESPRAPQGPRGAGGSRREGGSWLHATP